MALTQGARLGPYEVVAALGAGGMGEVYRAHDTKLHRDVALKVLPAAALADSQARGRLLREARLAASLNHPAICTVHDVDEADAMIYVAMELVNGRPLADLIPKDGFAADVVVRYGLQIADALAHAHEHGIVHRDLKGANVLVLADGRVKVLDFGLATRHATAIDDATRTAASLDSAGIVAGTLPYMAPDALRGAPADPRCDVWSLGVLLYEMISGHRPFRASSSVDLASAILRDPIPPLARAPAGLAAVIDRCLEKQPAQRYGSGAEVRAALTTVGSAAPVRPPVARSKGVIAAVAIVALLAVGLFVWRALPRNQRAATPATTAIRALAVLPFENASGDAAQEYFADGLTDQLIARLSRLPDVVVRARAAVMPFKGKKPAVEAIARQLDVQAVVLGTVVRSGDRVRVAARLRDAAGSRDLWTANYERAASDVLAIQNEIAASIGGAIRVDVLPEERRRLTSIPAVDSQAYDFYLRGRFYAGRESPEAIAQAIDLFGRAVAVDPAFAAAHAELARAYSQRLFYVAPNDSVLQERAFVEIERALALDPTLDMAHLARGLLLWQPLNHFPHQRAIAEYRRAIALNPNSDEAHHQLGLVYVHVGLLDEARREIDEAMRLNPANTLAQFRRGVIALYAGQYDEAAAVFRGTPPDFQQGLRSFQLADSVFHLGRKDDARATVEAYLRTNARDLGGMNTAFSALLAADAGDRPRAESLIKQAQEKGRGFGHFHHTAYTIARAYALLGRADAAVTWLRNAADDGYPCYPAFDNDRTLDRVRDNTAFRAFMGEQRQRWEGFKKLARE